MKTRNTTYELRGKRVSQFVFWLACAGILIILSPFMLWLAIFCLALFIVCGTFIAIAYVWHWMSGRWLFGFEYEETRSEITYEAREADKPPRVSD